MSLWFLIPALLFALWLWARWRARQRGLLEGAVVYQDTGRDEKPGEPLYSEHYGLVGRPDYLVRRPEGVIPVELKTGACPTNGPYESHVGQLFSYCLVVEDALGASAPYGVLRYGDREVRLEFTPARRRWIEGVLEEITAAREAGTVSRNHCAAGRCRSCGVRGSCAEALA